MSGAITIKARFDGAVFVPETPLHLPEGTELEISIPSPTSEAATETTLERLARIADDFEDDPNLPDDLAAQHDHYLYGTPKKP